MPMVHNRILAGPASGIEAEPSLFIPLRLKCWHGKALSIPPADDVFAGGRRCVRDATGDLGVAE